MRNVDTHPQWINSLVNAYEVVEGKGNQMNDQILRGYGVAEETYQYYAKKTGNEGLSDRDASLLHSYDNHNMLIAKMPGYEKAPMPIQWMLLDLAYNTTVMDVINKKKYPKLHKEMGDLNWLGSIAETMDTANVDGFISSGVMKRRAFGANPALVRIPKQVFGEYLTAKEQNKYLEKYGGVSTKKINQMIEQGGMRSIPIRSVTATREGEGVYRDIDGNAIFKVFNPKGLHKKNLGATGVYDFGMEGVNMQRVEYGH